MAHRTERAPTRAHRVPRRPGTTRPPSRTGDVARARTRAGHAGEPLVSGPRGPAPTLPLSTVDLWSTRPRRGRTHRLRLPHDGVAGPPRRARSADGCRLGHGPAGSERLRLQHRRHARAAHCGSLSLDASPGAVAAGWRPDLDSFLLRPGLERSDRGAPTFRLGVARADRAVG